ncbi:MAG: GtrA family protein [Patescibacteria group bacterium]|nr:GtrA family protein [Patescibacteria group bacterium]MCL5431535.1 GtrA family protein [Patescibacteria group bacterium]
MSDTIIRFLKFAVVGTIGFIVNTTGLLVGVRIGIRPSLAGPAGAEFAIISNFILNNIWTFSDRSLALSDIPGKFAAFNVLSLGSVVIQFLFLRIGEMIFGLEEFKKPFPNLPFQKISPYMFFYVAGVGVGLIVNYVIYSQIIWK